MTDSAAIDRSSPRHLAADSLLLLDGLPPDKVRAVRDLIVERDHLVTLHEVLLEVDRAGTLEERLRVLLAGVRRLGFGRAAVSLLDHKLDTTLLLSSGMSEEEEDRLRATAGSGEAWRRRLHVMERFRISQSYYLDARDPWVAAEFHRGAPRHAEPNGDGAWHPLDALIVPLRGREGSLLAMLTLDAPVDHRRPSFWRVRTIELLGQQVVFGMEQAALVDGARRQAERLQRLHEVGNALARSLDEDEIVRELARQIARVLRTDGIVIAHADVERGRIVTQLRLVRGVPRPRGPVPLDAGPIAEVVRTGRPVRVEDYDRATAPMALADDVVGDGGPARSLLAAPMMIGVQMVGVVAIYSAGREPYTAGDEELLRTMAAQAATSLANARLYAESQRERRQNEALADIARAVGESLEPGEVLRLIMRHAVALLRAEGACVTLRNGEELDVVAAVGSAETLVGMRVPISRSLSGRALRQSAPVIANDVHASSDAYHPSQEHAAVAKTVVVPLITGRGTIGTLAIINRPNDFDEDDARVLQRLADQVAVAIVNARLFEQAASATREWQVAFDAIAAGMVVLDAQGRIRRCNSRAVALTEVVGPEKLLGRTFPEAVLLELLPPDGGVVRTALVERRTARAVERSPNRGKLFDVLASPHPAGGAVVTFDDVTEYHTLAERHRRVIETSSDAIVITDPQRRIAFANPAAVGLFGYPAERLIGLPVAALTPPDLHGAVTEYEDAAFRGEPQRYETAVVRADGDRRIVAVSTAPLRDVDQVTGVVASLRDITDERRARDAVAQSEARYRNLFETASDAIFTLDEHGSFTSANRATCEATGYPREELLGCSIVPLLEPDQLETIRSIFRQVRAGAARRFEGHFVRRGGDRRLASITATPILHGSSAIGVLAIARDITAERQRAEELRASETRYRSILDTAYEGVWTVDAESRTDYVNGRMAEMLGYSVEEMVGRPMRDFVDEELLEEASQNMERRRRGVRELHEFRLRRKDGALISVLMSTGPITNERGEFVGALAMVTDITERKQAAAERERLQGQLAQSQKMQAVGELVSGVAHELNNPLAGIMAFAQLLLAQPPPDGELLDGLTTIHREAKRAARIVSNLLLFARQRAPERSATDLNQVLLDTLELRRYALLTQQVEVETDLEPDLPRTWADAFQLQQVFLNLLTNAEHALRRHDGPRRVTLQTRRRGDWLVATVADSGPGIAAEIVGRIFDPFYTTKPVGEGTGLGLSISDGIVRQHNGQIRVDSTPGAGTTFTVELPLVAVPLTLARTGAAPDPAPASRHVLIADDEAAIRDAVATFLRRRGYIVDTAAGGGEALASLRSNRYDVVVLDLRMPDVSGAAVYAALREEDPQHARRVVFATGDLESEPARSFLAEAGRPYLSKPFDLDAIAELVASA